MEKQFYYHLHVQAGECSRIMKSGRYLQRLCQKIKGELKSGKSHQRKIYGRQKISLIINVVSGNISDMFWSGYDL